MVGATVTHYRVLERLGSGGMGVVYKAEDVKLGRAVALKFLPAGLSSDALALERFEREARAASALNHPSICTIYEIDEADGQKFIAMELIEGRTLWDHVAGGPMDLDLALDIALQISDALDAAHEKGIIHRDIKPGNLLLNARGQAKIMDFGLAKLASERRVAEVAGAPTMHANALPSESLTSPGIAVGTAAYMSPEQARGFELDARTDVFSFGGVLYEVTTGKPAFPGNTSAVIFDAILNRDPTPPSRYNPNISPELERIILKALEKNRGMRYQSAAELRADLKRLKRETDSARVMTVQMPAARLEQHPTQPATQALPVHRPQVTWALVVGVVVLLAALLWVAVLRPKPEPVNAPGRLTLLVSSETPATNPAISPDGKMLVFALEENGQYDLYAMRVAGGTRLRLTNDVARESEPAFSPDGERIAFARLLPGAESPEVCVVPTLGGAVTTLLTGADQPVWSPDGKRLAIITRHPRAHALMTMTAEGANLRTTLASDSAYPFLRNATWSPDNKTLAVVRSSGGVAAEIWLAASDGASQPRRLSRDAAGAFSDEPAFTADGRAIVYSSNRGGATNLWRAGIDGGAQQQLTFGPGPDESPSVARDGTIAFLNSRARRILFTHSPASGESRTLLTHPWYFWAPAFSPDGREIAFSRSEADGSWHIWMVNADGSGARQVTNTPQGEVYPRYTPDGQHIIYFNWSGTKRVWRVPRGGGAAQALTPDRTQDDAYGDVSSDGRWLAFARDDGKQVRIHIGAADGSGEARALTADASTLPRWSPDGKWIAYSPDRSRDAGIFVIRPDGSGQRQLTESGGWPFWMPDGKRVAYLANGPDGSQELRVVPLEGGASRPFGGIRFQGTNFPVAISPDGRTLATSNAMHTSSEIWVLQQN